MKNKLQVNVGIFYSCYTLIKHRNGTVTVKVPYIKWINNNGNLAFTNYHITNKDRADSIKKFFENGTLCIGHSILEDFLF